MSKTSGIFRSPLANLTQEGLAQAMIELLDEKGLSDTLTALASAVDHKADRAFMEGAAILSDQYKNFAWILTALGRMDH